MLIRSTLPIRSIIRKDLVLHTLRPRRLEIMRCGGVVNVVDSALLLKALVPSEWKLALDNVADIVFAQVVGTWVDPCGGLFAVVDEEISAGLAPWRFFPV